MSNTNIMFDLSQTQRVNCQEEKSMTKLTPTLNTNGDICKNPDK